MLNCFLAFKVVYVHTLLHLYQCVLVCVAKNKNQGKLKKLTEFE